MELMGDAYAYQNGSWPNSGYTLDYDNVTGRLSNNGLCLDANSLGNKIYMSNACDYKNPHQIWRPTLDGQLKVAVRNECIDFGNPMIKYACDPNNSNQKVSFVPI